MSKGDKVFRSKDFDPNFRKPKYTLFTYIESEILKKVHEDPDFTCIIDGSTGKSIKVSDILPTTKRISNGLAKVGFKKGDVLCLVSENRCDVYYAILATLSTGGALCSLVPYLSPDEMESLLCPTEPKLIICCEQSEKTIKTLKDSGCIKPEVLVFSFDDSVLFPKFLQSVGDEDNGIPNTVDIDLKNDPILIFPSSGTTSLPKLIQHTNYSLTVGFENMRSRFHGSEKLTVLMLNCFYHFTAFLFSFFQLPHNTVITLSELPYTEKQILECIQKYQVNMMTMFPFQLSMLSNFPHRDEYDISSLQSIFVGGSKLLQQDRMKFERVYPGIKVIEVYGTTEMSLVTNATKHNSKSGSIGVLEPFVEAKVLHCETGEMLGPGEEGELCFKTPCLMLGYTNMPEFTKEVIDADGFYHTGDVGYIDQDCQVYILDRIKSYIKFQTKETSIITLYSCDLENVILGHPQVYDVAVCNVEDSVYQEVPRAYVQLMSTSEISEEELLDYANERLDEIRQLRGGLKFVSGIPRNYNGKILRHKLKQL